METKGRQSLPIRLNRNSPSPMLVPFFQHFQGFEKVTAVRSVFGEETDTVLHGLKIGFIPNKGMYMGIRDNDGNIAVGTYHLRTAPTRTLYLDIVHELFHIGQRRKNGKWFHDEFMKFMKDRSLYYASPIEIPAYQHTVREAERIGMTEEEILTYLKFGDPPGKVWRSFVREMALGKAPPAKKVTRFPVKINRDAKAALYPFSEYFLGFDKVKTVKELLGESTGAVLDGLKVEFIDSPFPAIYPSEGDGHLIVASEYFRKGDIRSLYLDAFLCLSMLKSLSSEGAGRSEEDVWENPGMQGAYTAMVNEARRIGSSEEEILGHLALPSFLMPKTAYGKFLRSLGLKRARANPNR